MISNVLNEAGTKGDQAKAFDARLMCLWLVDDQEDYRQMQSNLLNAEEGVICAQLYPSAPALLAALKHERAPDVILLDVEMPEMSGLEAIRPILNLAPATQVVMISSFNNRTQWEGALAAGASGFLIKGVTSKEIVTELDAILARTRNGIKG